MTHDHIKRWSLAALGAIAVSLLAYASPLVLASLSVPTYLIVAGAVVCSLDVTRLLVGLRSRTVHSILLGAFFMLGVVIGDYGQTIRYGSVSLHRMYFGLIPSEMRFVPAVVLASIPLLTVAFPAMAAAFFSIKSAIEPRFQLHRDEAPESSPVAWNRVFRYRNLRRLGLRLSIRITAESYAALVGRSRAGVPGLAIGYASALFLFLLFYLGSMCAFLLRGFGAAFGYFERASSYGNASNFLVCVVLLALVMANRSTATEGIRALIRSPSGVLGLGVAFSILTIALGVPSIFAPPQVWQDFTPIARYSQLSFFASCPLLVVILSRLELGWVRPSVRRTRWDLMAIWSLNAMYAPHALDKLLARENLATGMAEGLRASEPHLFDLWTAVMLTAFIALGVAALVAGTQGRGVERSSAPIRWAMLALLTASALASSSTLTPTLVQALSATLFIALLGTNSYFLTAFGGNLEGGGRPVAYRQAMMQMKRGTLALLGVAFLALSLLVLDAVGGWEYRNAVAREVLLMAAVGMPAFIGIFAAYALWSMRYVSRQSLRLMGRLPESSSLRRLRDLRLDEL